MSNKAKTFSLHWGSGIVEEEAQIQCEYHIPTIQLITIMRGVFNAPLLFWMPRMFHDSNKLLKKHQNSKSYWPK